MTKRHRDGSITVQLTKRHTKPTSAQLAARMYRQLLAIKKEFGDQVALTRLNFNSNLLEMQCRLADLKPIVDHCERLMREKETLQRQVEELKTHPLYVWPGAPAPPAPPLGYEWIQHGIPTIYSEPPQATAALGDFQAARHGECAFASTHRAGVRCGVCGETGA
jgi:hypothetical protein